MTIIRDLPNKISTLNAFGPATLAPLAVYQGTGEDVSEYGRVGVAVTSSNASSGVLTMEVSHDNITWGGPSRNWSDTRFSQPHMWNIVEKYFRIKYTNGTQEVNDLCIQVQYSNNADIILGHQLDEELKDEVEAIVTRATLVGRNADGRYNNIAIDDLNRLQVNQEENENTRVLKQVLTELKIMNEYNALMHETTITKEES